MADRAGLGCLRTQLLVGLPVARQVGAGGKVLSTLVTLILVPPLMLKYLDVNLWDGDV